MKFTPSEVRLLRLMRNMPQKEIAGILKISTQRYSILEKNDSRPVERTREILSALNLTEKSAREFLNSRPDGE